MNAFMPKPPCHGPFFAAGGVIGFDAIILVAVESENNGVDINIKPFIKLLQARNILIKLLIVILLLDLNILILSSIFF